MSTSMVDEMLGTPHGALISYFQFINGLTNKIEEQNFFHKPLHVKKRDPGYKIRVVVEHVL